MPAVGSSGVLASGPAGGRSVQSVELISLPANSGLRPSPTGYAAIPLLGLMRNFSPVACLPYAEMASSESASARETSFE